MLQLTIEKFRLETYFVFFYILLGLLCCASTSENELKINSFDQPVTDRPCNYLLSVNNSHLTTPQIINIYGYTVETHTIVTEDGYILETHRIPAPGKPAVLILHGIMMSSREALLNCDRRAMAIRFADENLDVWLANYRGTIYSMQHRFLRNTRRRYWKFSYDEVGYYDVPANIDYILKVTGMKKLSWVGYSMGNAVMFGLLSVRPEYNDKVHMGFALGAAAGLGHTRNYGLNFIAPYHRFFDVMVNTLHHGEVLPRSLLPIFHQIGPNLCTAEISRGGAGICSLLQIMIDGYDGSQVDPRVFQSILSGTPQPISVRMFTHWLQWIRRDKFSHYDLGRFGNLRRYGQLDPPDYDIGKVTSPAVFFWAENDHLTSQYDVHRSVSQVGNIYRIIKLNSSLWNHIDFQFGKDADIYIYNEIIQILKDSLQGNTSLALPSNS